MYKEYCYMVWKTALFNVFFCFMGSLLTQAQTSDIQIKVFGAEDAISHRNIIKVAQDSSGFIWTATFSGLNRFDGYNFKKYFQSSNEHGILFENLNDLLIHPSGSIWLAKDNKLLRFNPDLNTTSIFSTIEKDSSRQRVKVANYLFPFDNNQFLFTRAVENSENAQLFITDHTFSPRLLATLTGKYDYHPVILHDACIWAGANENELWKMDTSGQLLEVFSFEPLLNGQPASSRVVHLYSKGKKLWVLLENNQLFFLDENDKEPQKHDASYLLPHVPGTTDLAVLDDGTIWICGQNQLWYINTTEGNTRNYHIDVQQFSKGINKYRSLFTDYSGTLWVSSDFGLVKLVKSRRPFESFLSGGNDNCSNGYCSIRGMAEGENGTLFVSYYNSIHKIQPDGTVEPVFSSERLVTPPFGLLYQNGRLYTGSGMVIDLKAQKSFSILNEPPVDKGAVAAHPKTNEIWLGLFQKLYRYQPSTGLLVPFSDSIPNWNEQVDISYLYFGKKENTLWIGTNSNGVFKLNMLTKEFEQYHANGLGHFKIEQNAINAVYEDAQHSIWLTTPGGLLCLKKGFGGDSLLLYGTEDGLPHQYTNGILGDGDSCLWISTNNGLSRFDLRSQTFSNYYQEDGLSENEFNRMAFLKAQNGRMYFGGINGVNAFFPQDPLLRTKIEPKGKILFTGFSHFNSKIDSLFVEENPWNSASVSLTHHDRFFTFEFALANYAQPSTNNFSYKLDGFDSNWSEEAAFHSARYHNIPPGKYTFRVKASASKGNWVRDQLAVPVSIEQPYYLNGWFITSIPFLLSFILFGLHRYSVFRAKRQERILQQEVRIRTKQLEEEKRKSDELLLNILPAETAKELMQFGQAKARRHEKVTVLFSDFQSFTKIAEQLEPEVLVSEIDYCFRNFDNIIEKYQLEKIKTIGDAYMCVGGITDNNVSLAPAIRVIQAAQDMQKFLYTLELDKKKIGKPVFKARIGIHTGPVVSGIVGSKKFAYDIWGDTVNVAARLERQCEVGKINISQTTFHLIKEAFTCDYRGKILAKNKGEIDMYYIKEPRHSRVMPESGAPL